MPRGCRAAKYFHSRRLRTGNLATTSSSAVAFPTTKLGKSIQAAGRRLGLICGSCPSRRKRPQADVHMIFKQFYLPCLAHASYIIGGEATGTAAI